MKKYTEIFKLKEMLEEAGIPFTFTDDLFNAKAAFMKNPEKAEADRPNMYPAYQIRIGHLADAIQHHFSYGEASDLIEIMGGLTEEEGGKEDEEVDGEVLGGLTAEEVFKRFKYCYIHNTRVYKEETVKYERLTPKVSLSDELEGSGVSLEVLRALRIGRHNIWEYIDRLVELENMIEHGELVFVPKNAVALTPKDIKKIRTDEVMKFAVGYIKRLAGEEK